MRQAAVSLVLIAMLSACRAPAPEAPSASTAPEPDATVPPGALPSPAPSPAAPTSPPAPTATEVRYRLDNRAVDSATAGFAGTVRAVLTDPRGWVRAGFRFVEDADAPYRIVLAEGAEVDALCAPLETWSTYSCQNGPVVALNADRWRSATPQWPAGLDEYRVMLVNHEVGHLLHLHHPRPQCPAAGLPAPVMAQQSTELGACLPNPWPLDWEVALAAERREPLAPPAEHDPAGHRPTAPPATS
ncbi:MAG TPA: DUF3152 domain-containing protein [Egibacteraceae bacterium]|nr:DUF3152 domain-containing protein [Egibacteraceae bacterium]